MAKTITTRLPDEFILDITRVAEEENVDRSSAIRKLLAMALKQWKTKKALELLRQHKISIGKASEISEVTLWEMIDLAGENNIDWVGYDEADLNKSLSLLK